MRSRISCLRVPDWSVRTRIRLHSSQRSTSSSAAATKSRRSAALISSRQPVQRRCPARRRRPRRGWRRSWCRGPAGRPASCGTRSLALLGPCGDLGVDPRELRVPQAADLGPLRARGRLGRAAGHGRPSRPPAAPSPPARHLRGRRSASSGARPRRPSRRAPWGRPQCRRRSAAGCGPGARVRAPGRSPPGPARPPGRGPGCRPPPAGGQPALLGCQTLQLGVLGQRAALVLQLGQRRVEYLQVQQPQLCRSVRFDEPSPSAGAQVDNWARPPPYVPAAGGRPVGAETGRPSGNERRTMSVAPVVVPHDSWSQSRDIADHTEDLHDHPG